MCTVFPACSPSTLSTKPDLRPGMYYSPKNRDVFLSTRQETKTNTPESKGSQYKKQLGGFKKNPVTNVVALGNRLDPRVH